MYCSYIAIYNYHLYIITRQIKCVLVRPKAWLFLCYIILMCNRTSPCFEAIKAWGYVGKGVKITKSK